MINRNARRTGAAGAMARALGTLGAATMLLTSTGSGALAVTGFGAINLKAYQGAAAWRNYTEAQNNAAAVARQARGGPSQFPPKFNSPQL
jgi:hypothetical protein